MTSVIEFQHVSKQYQFGQTQTSLREALAGLGRRLSPFGKVPREDHNFWALHDVSFQVQAGDILGLIGHNGAGKSTALKLLSRVTKPTSGSIVTRGRLAALIELGAGFHPDLTGRENIFLNGVILGLKEREIKTQFDSIVAFAGLEKFIDTPVKRYSSGMYVRLAFAVAAHVQADLLLIDEVLAVGDTAFQQKCLDKMRELHTQGVTLVLVTHNLWTVESFCNRAILLNQGQIQAEGLPGEVIQAYRQNERQGLAAGEPAAEVVEAEKASDEDETTVITRVELLDKDSRPRQSFEAWDRITVRAHYRTLEPIQSPFLIVRVTRSDGVVCCRVSNNREPNFAARRLEGEGFFEVTVGPLPLMPDTYTLETHIADNQRPVVHASSSKQTFQINGDLGDPGEAGVFWVDAEWTAPETIR